MFKDLKTLLSRNSLGSAALCKGTKMDTIKDRNCTNLTEAEDIKKRWQEYTEELYRKGLHDPDNHDGVITHLEPEILESKVKWTLGSITKNKASGGDGLPVELFQIPPLCCAFTNRVAFEEGSGPRVLLKGGPGNRGHSDCGPTHVARLEFPRETGLILRCAGKAGNH